MRRDRRRQPGLTRRSPGEALPNFPQSTHGRDTSEHDARILRPLTTVRDAISRIPDDATHHNPKEPLKCPQAAWDDGAPLRNCVTTSGGEGNYHPSGLRKFTNRELASLQSFPPSFRFSDTGVKRQIGNAVPPVVARVLFDSIRRALLEADGLA